MKKSIIIIVTLILVLSSAIVIMNKNNFAMPEPLEYDDYFQRSIVSILSTEYLRIERYKPDDMKLLDSKKYATDTHECSPNNIMYLKTYSKNLSCTKPLYWKEYSFTYENGTVIMGFKIFEDNATAERFIDESMSALSEIIKDNDIQGYRVESKVMIVPVQNGPMIERIELFVITLPQKEHNNVLITYIKNNNTIYAIYEESKETIYDRQFLYAFSQDLHEDAIETWQIEVLP